MSVIFIVANLKYFTAMLASKNYAYNGTKDSMSSDKRTATAMPTSKHDYWHNCTSAKSVRQRWRRIGSKPTRSAK